MAFIGQPQVWAWLQTVRMVMLLLQRPLGVPSLAWGVYRERGNRAIKTGGETFDPNWGFAFRCTLWNPIGVAF
jgi:hypothetical protein